MAQFYGYSDPRTWAAYTAIVNHEPTYYRALTARSPKELRKMFGRTYGTDVDWDDVYDSIFDEAPVGGGR